MSVLVPLIIFSVGIFGAGDLRAATAQSIPAERGTSDETAAGLSNLPDSASAPDSRLKETLNQLSKLPDAPAAYLTGYERDYFGHGWIDVDRNGCDTRNDILRRDLSSVVHKRGTYDCVVLSGELDGPYTGRSISFTRGNKTSTLVQIDHIVPLGYAWQVGAAVWTEEERIRFANDPGNLLAVDGEANQIKSANGPSGWVPPNENFRCTYIEMFVGILFKYQLAIDAQDRKTSEQVLTSCR